MSPSILKLAPRAVVLAAAVYWSWPALAPHVSGVNASAAKSSKPDSPAEFAASALSVDFPPAPTRNPFLPPGGAAPAGGKASLAAEKKTELPKRTDDAREAGLTLDATCIVGEGRLAAINGRIYREKEAIAAPNDDSASYIVTDIRPHQVLLTAEGRILRLNYENGAKPSRAKSSENKPRSGSDPPANAE